MTTISGQSVQSLKIVLSCATAADCSATSKRTGKRFALSIAFFLSTSAFGALPGVTDFRTSPEKVTDAELSTLLRERVASVDVIAIGETVHGSSGFLRMQTRLIRYLVSNHGLRLMIWENGTLRSLELARWVSSCTKAKTPVPIDVLYFPTESDRALWDWVCDFNRAHPDDPIVFRGMDVWDRPWEHYSRIRSLGSRIGIDSSLLKRIEALCPASKSSSWVEIEAIYGVALRDGRLLPEADYEHCRAALTAVFNTSRQAGMERKKNSDAGSDEAFELALSASTVLGWLGFYNYNWSDDILSWNERDRAQGRNIMLLMAKHDATRAIVSAHTSHVSHNRSPADWWGYGDLKSGVFFFTEMTRNKVFNIALTAYEASGSQGNWSLPTAQNSLDKKLHEAGHEFAFFPSNAAFLSENAKWWMQNQNVPGAHESGVEIVPRDHFDAFIFFKRSHLDKALPSRSLWEP
jgi:erythromycin esterase-like protein